MIDILEELFNGNIQEVFRTMSKEYKTMKKKESVAYDNLAKVLNDEQLKLLDNYIEASQDSNEIEVKERYKQGFKTGVLIGIECKNIKL